MNATVTYKCPNCDAGLIFNAEEQKFSCEFCLSHFTEEELAATSTAERVEEMEKANAEFAGEMREYHCPSCGAEVIAEKNTVADLCVYCHNPVVLSDQVTGVLKPNRVIPFKLTKDDAVDEFLRFSKKKKFVPKNFFSRDQLSYLSGVYYPFWVTDADTDGFMRATGKKVRTWTSGDYRYTETKTYAVERGGPIHFEDISTAAITNEDKDMLEGVLPYPAEEYQDFSMPYLQGFVAKKRDIDKEQLYGEVKGKMNSFPGSHMALPSAVLFLIILNGSQVLAYSIPSKPNTYTSLPLHTLFPLSEMTFQSSHPLSKYCSSLEIN